MDQALTRKGAAVLGGLNVFLRPLLAADAKIGDQLHGLLTGVTAKNFSDMRPVIAAGVIGATHGKLTSGASLKGLDGVLLALDEMEETPEGEDEGESEEEKKEREAKEAKDKRARDRKSAKDKKARDAMEKACDEAKMPAEDKKRAMDAYDAACAGRDEKDDEEDERTDPEGTNDRRARDRRAKDEEDDEEEKKKKEAEDKRAMDAAISSAVSSSEKKHRAIRDAERFVRPWVGELSLAFDSADEVFAQALKMRGEKIEGVHPSAYKLLLERLPKAGQQRPGPTPALAHDSSATKSFGEMFPGADKIRLNG